MLRVDPVVYGMTGADEISRVEINGFKWVAVVFLESGWSINALYRLDYKAIMCPGPAIVNSIGCSSERE